MSHFACFGLIMVNLVDCYILDCGNDNRLEDYANSVCVCVPRDWFRGPKLTCTLGTHNVPQGLNTVQGIYVLRCACHMPSVFGRVDMWAMRQ